MRTASAPLIAHLTSANQTLSFDLWTFTLLNGTVLRWTDADQAITSSDGRTFNLGPVMSRDRVTWSRGITVDSMSVDLSGKTPVTGTPLIPFITAGGFDSAAVLLERVFIDSALAVKGELIYFSGTIADIEIKRSTASLTVKSDLQNLDVMMPRNLWQPECINDLYDSSCRVPRALYAVNASVAGVDPNNARSYLLTAYAGKPDGYFNLGQLTFTSGQNVGQSRTIKLHRRSPSTSDFQFARPFAFPILQNHTFTVVPGCDKTMVTCRNVYNNVDSEGNLHHYRGTPFIPAPEVVT